MITFERSTDYVLIRSILTHSRIYDKISDDYSPPREEYRPIRHEGVWYVVARDVHAEGADLLGLWMFHPQNGICWEVHTALLPVAWGAPGREAAQLLPGWIWRNTPCRRIVTNVPTTNRLALHFAVNAGMKIYGVNEASYLKNGRLCDQVCLGISAPREVARSEAETGCHAIEPAQVGPEEGV
jgi:RimJ/RimL family protein N-acetyltransferase